MTRMMSNPRRSSTGATLDNHLENEWCKKVGCVPVVEEEPEFKGLKTKMGEEYWKMLEETAKRVDTWPEWKKGKLS